MKNAFLTFDSENGEKFKILTSQIKSLEDQRMVAHITFFNNSKEKERLCIVS